MLSGASRDMQMSVISYRFLVFLTSTHTETIISGAAALANEWSCKKEEEKTISKWVKVLPFENVVARNTQI